MSLSNAISKLPEDGAEAPKHVGAFVIHFNIYIYIYIYLFIFPPVALRPNAGHGLLILDVSRSHTTTHYSR